MSPTPWVEVVAAVIERPDGAFLLAQRPAGKVYAGYWEFPGGKVEGNETTAAALRRELAEELDIEIDQAYPWVTRTFIYAHASVRLNFFRVDNWRGVPRGVEGQRIAWQCTGELKVSPMLPANGPILRALSLPLVYAVTPDVTVDERQFLTNFDRALVRGLRMVQLRDKQGSPDQLRSIGQHLLEGLSRVSGLLLINSETGRDGATLARILGARGLHLNASALMSTIVRPDADWVGASCHNAEEMHQAAAVGVDFVVLGPVCETDSHPHAELMGWDRFRRLAEKFSLPIFAIGGLKYRDLDIARTNGAHGIAMMRGAWNQTIS